MIFKTISSSFPSAMERKQDKNKENTLCQSSKVMQNTNCTICAGQRISAASFIADKYPGKHFVCVSSSYLSGKNNISLLGSQYF